MKNIKKTVITLAFLTAVFALQSQTLYFQDNFDSYTAGVPLTLQNNTDWFTWSDGPGTAQDPLVSNANSLSSPNAVHIIEENDIVYKFPDLTSGHYIIETDYFMPSGSLGGSINVLHHISGLCAFICFFDGFGNGQLRVATDRYNFNIPVDAWFHIKIDIDLDADLCVLLIESNVIYAWPFSYQYDTANPGEKQLSGVNIYDGNLGTPEGGGNFFVDNFTVWEIKPAQQGVFVIDPETPIVQNINITESKIININLSNQGDAPVEYEVIAVYNISEVDHTSTGMQALSLCSMPSTDGVGFGEATQFSFASGYSPAMLKEHIGKTVRQFDFEMMSSSGILSAKLCIWDMTHTGMPGLVPIYEQSIPVSSLTLNNSVILNTPWLIDGRYLFIGLEMTVVPWTVGVNLDTTPVAQCNYLGRLYELHNYWGTLNETYSDSGNPLNGMWNMTLHVDGTPITPWMDLNHTAATLQPDENKNLAITFGADDIVTPCVKNAQLYFHSNDYFKQETILDATAHFILLGIESSTNEVEMKLYPNPAFERVNVECNERINSIQILNYLGQTLFTHIVNGEKTTLDISTMNAGTYFIKINTDNCTFSRKLIVW